MRQNLAKIARDGQGGDSLLGHLTRGDVVVPVEKITPQVKGLLASILGAETARFTAGNRSNRINTTTSLPEFTDGGEGAGGGTGDGEGVDNAGAPDNSNGGVDTSGNGSKSSTALGEEHNEDQSISDTSIGNQIGNVAQSALTAMSAMLAGVNAPSLSGAAKGALLGVATGGLPGALMGAFTGAAPGMPSITGTLADHGVDTGNNPGGTGDPGQSGGGNGSSGGVDPVARQAGLINALVAPAPATATPPAPTSPATVLPPFWWQRVPRTLR